MWKSGVAIFALAAAVAFSGAVLLARWRDGEPAPAGKVELAAKELPEVIKASCRPTAAHRFRCRLTRADRRIDVCRAGTDADGRLSTISCRPASAR